MSENERLLTQLKLADKNYLELKNEFDSRLVAARAETLKEIIDWGVEPCPHWHMYPDVGIIKRDCGQCWEALKGGPDAE